MEKKVCENRLEGLEEWLNQRGRSHFTIRGYKYDLKMFSRWLEREIGLQLSPENISAENIEQYRDYLLFEKRSNARTYNRRLAAIRAYLAWARTEGHDIGYPLSDTRMIREKRNPPRSLSSGDIKSLMREAKRRVREAKRLDMQETAKRDRAMLMMLINTGMTLPELSSLDLSDIELSGKSGVVNIKKNGSDGDRRAIKLDNKTIQAMREWLEVRPKIESRAVFTSIKTGNRLRRAGVQSRILKIARSANVVFSVAWIRHTIAKRLIEEGKEIEEVAEFLGLKDTRYTERRYQPAGHKKV